MSVSLPEPITEEEITNLVLPPPRRKKNMYLDNVKLSHAMTEWVAEIEKAKAAGLEKPRMPEYIGECVILIAENSAKKVNYARYSWKDEMIGDAILACCKYIHNFKPYAQTMSGLPNAYGYISMCVERVFIHTVENEKLEAYYKNKAFEMIGGPGAFCEEDLEALGEGAGQMMEDMINRVYEYEAKRRVKVEEGRQRRKEKEGRTMNLFDLFAPPQLKQEAQEQADELEAAIDSDYMKEDDE